MSPDAVIDVLLVEDDDVDALAVQRALDRSPLEFSLRHVSRIADAVAVLSEQHFDVAVLDLGLPDGVGLPNLTAVQNASPSTPVVILSGHSDADMAMNAVRAGAQDFINKSDLNQQLVVKSLTYAIHRKLTEVRLREGVDELQRAAQTDSLTGLLNRGSLFSQANQAWNRAVSRGSKLSCIMLDIDYFKKINDDFGHAAGDQALEIIADVLQNQSRSEDIVGRYGGEEFCIILPSAGEDAALPWAERTRLAVHDRLVETDRQTFRMTASLGVAEGPTDCGNVEQLIDRADQALLVSKQRGRNLSTKFTAIGEDADRACLDGALGPAPDALVRDYMTVPIRCLHHDDTIATAAAELLALGVNSLPVVDADDQLFGIISEKDLLDLDPTTRDWSAPVSKVANRTVVAFDKDDPLERVREFLSRVAMRRIVVVEEGRPVGVLSRANLLRYQLQCAAGIDAQNDPSVDLSIH